MAREPQHPASSDDDDDAAAASSSSAYSSCEESDLDRYCSADSVLGTASLAGSLANRSDLLDAFRDLPADDLLLPPPPPPQHPRRIGPISGGGAAAAAEEPRNWPLLAWA
uniref:Uncharacterized protein n=1 Tax=Ananas comosus var. bracteatus TaxID=296719 RepID=A0A6V7NZC4_ANACO|nr:unnamed protein product [Ananas comosus var. bracteatus]